MEIIRDIEGWRQVRDPKDGVTGWMSHILFSGKRYSRTYGEFSFS
jgi:SH3-like domain-containing protein